MREPVLILLPHAVYPLRCYPIYPKLEQVETGEYPPKCHYLQEHFQFHISLRIPGNL